MDRNKIGKFIAKLRIEKNMTQEDLAHELYVDRTVVSKWERGLYTPKHDIILKLSQLFDVSVNEIYFGERQNKENKNKVNEVTINIIKTSNKKIKRTILFSSLIIILMSIAFLTYYFINNYKSISVYTIAGSKNGIGVDGLLIISNEEMYIQFEKVDNLKYDEVKKFGLYYNKGQEKKLIYENTDNLVLYINMFGTDEDIPYDDFKYIRSNMYLEIFYKNGDKQKIELNLRRNFINKNIFSKKPRKSSEKELLQYDESIPEYIKENFKFDEDNECYYRKSKKEKFNLKEMYYHNAELYVVEEIYNGYILRFEYSFSFEDFHFYIILGDKEEKTFGYNVQTGNCYSKDCDKEKIEYFTKNYLSRIE